MGEGQEGETSAAFLKIRATGFAGQLSANQNRPIAISSPGGEEKGEGGRKTQIKTLTRPATTLSHPTGEGQGGQKTNF